MKGTGFGMNKNNIERYFCKEKVKACIVKIDDKLAIEYYQNEKARTKLHKINSCTKSFTGILLGICLDKGYINSLEETIDQYFPKYFDKETCIGKEKITIRNILTMSSGIDWPEFGEWNFFSPMNYSKDITQFVLSRPMLQAPGQSMNYSSGDTHLLGEIIANATNMPLEEFAKESLFKPLNISEYNWIDRDGHALAADGLRLKISDLIKLAELLQGEGSWKGKRIVSKEWMEETLKTRYLTYEFIGNYGYHLWNRDVEVQGQTRKVYFALGYRGQFAIYIPDLNLTAAIVSDVENSMKPFWMLIDSINSIK